MKILQLCKKFPYPLKDGESIAVVSLSRSIAELGIEVSLLAMNTTKHFFNLQQHPQALSHYHEIHTITLDNRIRPTEAFFNLFSTDSYHIQRFESTAFEQKLKSLLLANTYDVIQLETLYLAPYIPIIRKYSDAIVAMRAHNVEHEIWKRIAQNTRFWPKRIYLRHLTHKLERYEAFSHRFYDILVAISKRDLDSYRKMGYSGKGIVSPIGLDSEDYHPDYSSYQRPLSISFIGSLDWLPNVEGLQWFLDQVWGKLIREFPKLELHIAGRNTPKWMLKMKKKNVVVHGEVPDATTFINKHSMMIVPLLSGSGMRAKILEGMALGKVVLSTPLGLEGISARHQKEVLVADTIEAFVQNIKYAYDQKSKLEAIGRNARDFVQNSYDSRQIAAALLKTYASFTVKAI